MTKSKTIAKQTKNQSKKLNKRPRNEKSPEHYLQIEERFKFLEELENKGSITDEQLDEKKKLYNQLSAKRSREQKEKKLKDLEDLVENLTNENSTLKDQVEKLLQENTFLKEIISQNPKLDSQILQATHSALISQLSSQQSQQSQQSQINHLDQMQIENEINEDSLNSELGTDSASDNHSLTEQDSDIENEIGRAIYTDESGYLFTFFSRSHTVIYTIIAIIFIAIAIAMSFELSGIASKSELPVAVSNSNPIQMKSMLKKFDLKCDNVVFIVSETGIHKACVYTKNGSLTNNFYIINKLLNEDEYKLLADKNGDDLYSNIFKNSDLQIFSNIENEDTLNNLGIPTKIQDPNQTESNVLLIPFQNYTEGNGEYVFCKQKSLDDGQILNDIAVIHIQASA